MYSLVLALCMDGHTHSLHYALYSAAKYTYHMLQYVISRPNSIDSTTTMNYMKNLSFLPSVFHSEEMTSL